MMSVSESEVDGVKDVMDGMEWRPVNFPSFCPSYYYPALNYRHATRDATRECIDDSKQQYDITSRMQSMHMNERYVRESGSKENGERKGSW